MTVNVLIFGSGGDDWHYAYKRAGTGYVKALCSRCGNVRRSKIIYNAA